MGPKKAAIRASVSSAVAHDYAHTLEAMASEIRRLANERDRWKNSSNRVGRTLAAVIEQRNRLAAALKAAGVNHTMVTKIMEGSNA